MAETTSETKPVSDVSTRGFKNPRKIAAAVALLNLVINLAVFFASPPKPPQFDAQLYDRMARLVVGFDPADKQAHEDFRTGVEGMFVRGVAYPLFIGVLYRIAGSPQFFVVGLLQALMLPVIIFMTYRLGAELFNERIGLIAALLYSLYLPASWHTNFLLTETLLALFVTAALFLLTRFIREERTSVGFGLGLLAGLLGISHPLWMLFPFLLLLLLWIRYRDRRSAITTLRRMGVVAAGVLVVLVPWHSARIAFALPEAGRGQTGFGGGGGWTFYVGSRAETLGSTVPEDYIVVETYFPPGKLAELHEQIKQGEVTIEPHLRAIIEEKLSSAFATDHVLTDFDYYRAGIENWIDKPIQIPKLIAVKFYWYLLGTATTPSYPLESSPVSGEKWRVIFKFLNWPLVLAAIAGLWIVVREHRDRLIVFAPLIFHTATVILTYSDNRYKYPNMSAMFLLIALSVVFCWQKLKRNR